MDSRLLETCFMPAVFVLAVAVLVYIIVKHGYELKISNKKVEVTHKNSSTQNTDEE